MTPHLKPAAVAAPTAAEAAQPAPTAPTGDNPVQKLDKELTELGRQLEQAKAPGLWWTIGLAIAAFLGFLSELGNTDSADQTGMWIYLIAMVACLVAAWKIPANARAKRVSLSKTIQDKQQEREQQLALVADSLQSEGDSAGLVSESTVSSRIS